MTDAVAPKRGVSEKLVNRIVWAILFVVPVAVFITAALIEPAPAGHGTHMQLGLPPCGFIEVTGLPCPGCGLTTSFAHMIRGHFIGAAFANPFGVLLFGMTAAWIPLAAFGVVRGFSVLATLDELRVDRWGMFVVGSSMVIWGVRVVTLLLTR